MPQKWNERQELDWQKARGRDVASKNLVQMV
jgi:hypothetical protein